MNGSALNGNSRQGSFNGWNPEDFPDIKAEEMPEYIPVTAAEDAKPLGMLPQPEELAELQRLSQEYTPDVTGPLVGELKSSKALAIEYANADPTYVRKTASLQHKYDSYRTIRGDGNCGWRAVAFGFFELLLRSGDQNRIGMEHARITSLNGLMESVGYQSYVYEDFAEATFALFSTLQNNPADEANLLDTFNDSGLSDCIITHFKFLTGAWMKSSPNDYQPFLSTSVADFCSTNIEPYGVEIEHVGLMALIDCLILPAGMAVEIIYLDRSAGDEVNVHRFEKLEGDGILTPPDAPVLRLLYRPGHYDIVYKTEDLPPPVAAFPVPAAPPVQVSFLPTLPQQLFQATPAASFGPGGLAAYFSPTPFPLDLAGPGFDHPTTLPSPDPGNFRQSMLSIPEFQPSPFQPLPFQTTTFRNSPFNPSHFQSENFQPEIYQPPTSPTATTGKKGDKS